MYVCVFEMPIQTTEETDIYKFSILWDNALLYNFAVPPCWLTILVCACKLCPWFSDLHYVKALEVYELGIHPFVCDKSALTNQKVLLLQLRKRWVWFCSCRSLEKATVLTGFGVACQKTGENSVPWDYGVFENGDSYALHLKISGICIHFASVVFNFVRSGDGGINGGLVERFL